MDIKLKDFEGPLDLLLHLVSKYQMDIYDVPIVEVIEQYLAYISTLQAMKLEVAGEYMVMAQHDERAKFYSKPKQELIFEDAVLTHDKTVMDLFLSFSHVMAEKQKELKNSNTVIERDDYRIEDMMTIIVERLNATKKLVLTTVFRECQTLPEMITIFLATLELIKVHEVEVEQEKNFGDIVLRSVS